ncbi:MAG: cation:proton antiporter [Deinococcota bacterium]|nr:cation:proton antiporter [Deinococcota bacterium]
MEVIWVGIAFLLGMVANFLGLPPLIGYLGGGFALFSLGVEGGELLGEIAHYGVIFLLFALGLRIRLRNMVRPEVLGSSLLQIIISVALLTAIFTLFGITAGLGLTGAVVLAVLLGVASTVVAAKGLEERRELEAYHGRVAIGILIIEDIILIGVLAFAGLTAPSPWALALVLLPLLRPALLRILDWGRHEELHLLYGLLLALGGASLFTAVGLSQELGAFVAGILLSGSAQVDEIAERMWSLREGFLVAFFLDIGLAGFPDASGFAFALAMLLFLPLRVAVFFGLLTRFKLRARTAFFASASLASYSEFAIITGAVAAQAGLIPPTMVVVLAMTVALSFAFGAPFNRAAPRLYARLKGLLLRFERDVRHPDSQPESLGSARYLVVGMGRTGWPPTTT